MNYHQRTELFKSISAIRQRPVIAYVTSHRPNASAQIASDVIPGFIRQIQAIPKNFKEVDLLLISYGGNPTAAYRIITLLRERFEKVGVLIPFAAYSAATLLALGADEIVMHPFSNLGPVAPQLTHKRQNQEQVQFGSEDLRNFIEFLRKDVGLSDQAQMQKAFELVCNEIGAIPIGIAKRSAQLLLSMGEKLLALHLEDANQAKSIAETLNSSFFHHGYPLGRSEAKKIGLPIANPPDELETHIWNVYESFENEMQLNEPFDPVKVVLNQADYAVLLAPGPIIRLPNNLPPEILEQVYNSIIQQHVQLFELPLIDYVLIRAAIESEYLCCTYKTYGKILSGKTFDGSISINPIATKEGWSFEKP